MARIITIVGPTAGGKSALALRLAEEYGGEIINADALQVYRGFDIGTAKPGPEERARVRHHLIDILEPTQRYSAGEFSRRARLAIDEIHGRGRLPIVVGGSGLYIRALHEGISPIPSGDKKLRQDLRKWVEKDGLLSLYEKLRELDPETAARLPPGDRQRILRALEVVLSSGKPLSQWIAAKPFGLKRLPALRIGLTLPRRVIYDRIARRMTRMVEAGWVEEVESLSTAGIPDDAPAFQAIGYRQILRFLRGELSLNAALEETVRATRRFAKRQETWFRKEPDVRWFSPEELEGRKLNAIDISWALGLERSHGET